MRDEIASCLIDLMYADGKEVLGNIVRAFAVGVTYNRARRGPLTPSPSFAPSLG